MRPAPPLSVARGSEELEIDGRAIARRALAVLSFCRGQAALAELRAADGWGAFFCATLYALATVWGQLGVVFWVYTLWLAGAFVIALLCRVLQRIAGSDGTSGDASGDSGLAAGADAGAGAAADFGGGGGGDAEAAGGSVRASEPSATMTTGTAASCMGYALLPMALLAFLAVALPSSTTLDALLLGAGAVWGTVAVFATLMSSVPQSRRLLLLYPLAVQFVLFAGLFFGV